MRARLREGNPADAEPVARIYVDSWNAGIGTLMPARSMTPAEIERWRRFLAPGPVRWRVATASDVLVGFAGVGPSRDPVMVDLGELDTIAVDPGTGAPASARC